MLAFVVELGYGILCWWLFRGSKGLLALIVLGNIANLSLFSSRIPGPERVLAGHPLVVVTFILAQIAVTLLLVGVLARRKTSRDPATVSSHQGSIASAPVQP
jgi:hypothetical protein